MLLFPALAGFCFVLGCAKQQQSKAFDRLCVPDLQKPRAMEISEDVLAGMHFTIAKADCDQGIIVTKPLPGGEFFEFWRDDSVGGFNTTEASIHTLRRTAQLDLSQENGQTCINCTVKTERLYMPRIDVSSSGEAFRMYGLTSKTRQRIELPSQQRSWVDLGQDKMLATRILNRIQERACRTQ